ncbi:hypothetical protein PQX77_006151 [Marasmius sp. AFHP31]|nr:hypothetical protein PQX77_006151 [Marasmius sp. AFHP31]
MPNWALIKRIPWAKGIDSRARIIRPAKRHRQTLQSKAHPPQHPIRCIGRAKWNRGLHPLDTSAKSPHALQTTYMPDGYYAHSDGYEEGFVGRITQCPTDDSRMGYREETARRAFSPPLTPATFNCLVGTKACNRAVLFVRARDGIVVRSAGRKKCSHRFNTDCTSGGIEDTIELSGTERGDMGLDTTNTSSRDRGPRILPSRMTNA